MRSQMYLVLIRDGRLALAVGAALEDRLLRDGHRATALVPAVRGPEFAASGVRRLLAPSRSGSESAGHGPLVVALYEEGLLDSLASLGLPAYVGVRDGDEPRVARWVGPGAIMLPVATARDLVDAVADHTPWSRYAAGLPAPGAAAAPRVLGARRPGHGRPAARSRRVATVASVAAGPLLLAGLPPAAMAAGGVSQAAAVAAPASGATGAVLAADTQQAPSAAAPAAAAPPAPPAAAAAPPAPPAAAPNTWSDFYANPGTSIQDYTNATVTGVGAGNFPPGPADWGFSGGGLSGSPIDYYITPSAQGCSPYGDTWELTEPPPGCPPIEPIGSGSPTFTFPGITTASRTDPGSFPFAGSADHHLAPSLTTSSAGGSVQPTGNAPSGSTIGGSPGRTATAIASGVQPGQAPAKAGAGGGLAAPPHSQPSALAPSSPPQLGNVKVNPPVRPPVRSAAGGGGGGGGGASIPHFPVQTLPASQPIRATPIPPLIPGTPVTGPKSPGQFGRPAPQPSVLPYGDFYNPDGSDAPPNGGENPTLVASAGSGGSPTDGSGGTPTDGSGGSQGGAVVVADNSGGLGGGGIAPVGGAPVGGSPLGTNTGAGGVSPPAATPVAPITNDNPPGSVLADASPDPLGLGAPGGDGLDGAPGGLGAPDLGVPVADASLGGDGGGDGGGGGATG